MKKSRTFKSTNQRPLFHKIPNLPNYFGRSFCYLTLSKIQELFSLLMSPFNSRFHCHMYKPADLVNKLEKIKFFRPKHGRLTFYILFCSDSRPIWCHEWDSVPKNKIMKINFNIFSISSNTIQWFFLFLLNLLKLEFIHTW